MKVAQLHNGTEIHFPDGTPDEHMDAQVQQHLGTQAPQNPMPMMPQMDIGEIMPVIMRALSEYVAKQQMAQQSQLDADQSEQDLHVTDIQLRGEESKQKVMAIGAVAEGLGVVAQHLELLKTIAEQGQKMDVMVKAVNALSNTVAQCTKMVIDVLTSPRELYFDKGVPKGIQTVVKRKG